MTAFIEAASPHTMNTYGRLPIALSHGQGCRVWDINCKPYLDALGGIAVNTLGHNAPEAGACAAGPDRQADPHQQLLPRCPMQESAGRQTGGAVRADQRVLRQHSGLEANEAARSRSRASTAMTRASKRPEIIVYEKAFHGRSIATL
jgi:acetylornithine/N-succinyldiaminopimelate aminotransferase